MTRECTRIVKADVKFFNNLTDECRTGFLGSTAYSDDVIPTLVYILRDILGIMTADIYPYLCHHLDGKRMNLGGRHHSC